MSNALWYIVIPTEISPSRPSRARSEVIKEGPIKRSEQNRSYLADLEEPGICVKHGNSTKVSVRNANLIATINKNAKINAKYITRQQRQQKFKMAAAD